MYFAIAHGTIQNGEIQKHVGTVDKFTLNLFDGAPQQAPRASRLRDIYFWHGVLMIVAWYILMIPATLLARYYKFIVPSWFKVRFYCRV
jgi:hypothetical protein